MNNDDLVKKSFLPVVAQGAKLLILGSLPGDASLGQQEYYAHPRNAFWRIMGATLGFDHTLPYPDRLDALRNSRIALWDVVASGIRPGSLDSNIRDIFPNDIPGLLQEHRGITTIICNGGTSFRLLKKHFPSLLIEPGIAIRQLPSTSPAAAMFTFEQKLEFYSKIISETIEL